MTNDGDSASQDTRWCADAAQVGKNSKKKLKNMNLRVRKEHAEMDKTCFREIHVNDCMLNGAKVHDAVKNTFAYTALSP